MSVYPHPVDVHHEAPQGFVRKWIFSKDHKVIGIQYYLLALVSVFVGMGMSLLMRAQLGYPAHQWSLLSKLFPKGIAEGVFSPEFYLAMVTMHGTMMVFFVLTTAPQGGFGNYVLPIQIGAPDMAFPTLNMLSFWTTFPVLLGGCVLLMMDRIAGTSFFVPTGLVVSGVPVDHHGGSAILWQHMFWFFGHPEVYIAILPGMGATSQILSTFARKPIFGYKAMIAALFGIGALGFFVWGHHMFVSGMSPYSAVAFSLLTLSIGVPSAIKTFNWIGTLLGAKIRFTTPMLFAFGFVSVFVAVWRYYSVIILYPHRQF